MFLSAFKIYIEMFYGKRTWIFLLDLRVKQNRRFLTWKLSDRKCAILEKSLWNRLVWWFFYLWFHYTHLGWWKLVVVNYTQGYTLLVLSLGGFSLLILRFLNRHFVEWKSRSRCPLVKFNSSRWGFIKQLLFLFNTFIHRFWVHRGVLWCLLPWWMIRCFNMLFT